MTQIVEFVENQKLKFVAFNPIFTNIGSDVKKSYPSLLKDWNKKTFSSLHKHYLTTFKNEKFLLINCTNEFIIFDTDTKEDYIKLVTILKELDLYNSTTITKSARGDVYSYKRHFWFAVEQDEFSEMKKHKFGDMEVFIGSNCSIAERIESTLEELNILSYDMYCEIKNQFIPLLEYEEEKEEEVKPVINKKQSSIKPLYDNDPNLLILMDCMAPKRFINYNEWISIYWTFLNENYDMELFEQYSKKHYPNYNKENNDKILKGSSPCKGFKIATLYHYVKQDNPKVFNELQKTRTDFWKIFEDLKQHNEPAKLYYSMFPNKYVKSERTGWYEYDNNNILHNSQSKVPSSLHNHVSDTLQTLIKEQLTYIDISHKDYAKYAKMGKSAYDKCGQSPFINFVLNFLPQLYTIKNIDDLMDSNVDLFAFNNMLYDNTIKDFRPIKPNDYITKTTKYDINIKSNPVIKLKLQTLFRDMFKTKEMSNYNLMSIVASMFGNKEESFYINSGTGGNGKGVISNIIEKAFGNYFYSGGNTFLTSPPLPESSPNPTLYSLKGIRYFLTTEPESCSETKFNMGVVKKISGNDSITCRTLYEKDNITYQCQFTPFVQCNTKPKLDKIENSIKRRFKIIDFPFNFVDKEIQECKSNEKPGDNTIKTITITQPYINEFMLILLEINKTRPNKIKVPKEVLNEVDEYLNANNFIKLFLDENYEITGNDKDKINSKTLFEHYNTCGQFQPVSNVKFSEMMNSNNIKKKRTEQGFVYLGIKSLFVLDEEF
jgi:hypothetical protein